MSVPAPGGWRLRRERVAASLPSGAASVAVVLPLLVGVATLVTLFWVGHLGVRSSVEQNELLSEAEARAAADLVSGASVEGDEALRELLAVGGAADLATSVAEVAAEGTVPMGARLEVLFGIFGRERAERSAAAERRFLQLNALGAAALLAGAGASLGMWRRRWRQRWRRVELICADLEALGERPLASNVERGELRPRSDEIGRLEAAVARLGTRLADSFVHQQRLSQLGEHVAFIAHDLRNPLAAISGGLSLMAREGTWDRELGPILVDEARRMAALVEQLRDFGRKSERLQACDLRTAVDLSVRLARRRADESKVSLHVLHEGQAVVWARPNEVRQVVLNLVENAIDAARGSARAGVLVRTAACRTGAELVVEDSGPGVPAEDRERIFEAFVTRKEGGSGMGLAITRRIVERLGGSLEVGDSLRLGGAAFRVLLPAVGASARQDDAEGRDACEASDAARRSAR